MISPNPIKLYKYLGFKLNKVPSGLSRLFYLSFEDVLWDILVRKKVKKGATIMTPEFYCGDVEVNMANHGYKVVHYPVSKYFKINVRKLLPLVQKIKPDVLVIFHAFGITNNFFENDKWLKYLPEKTILVEDSVHKIIEPEKIRIKRKNHIVIDSLRKVIPLQGSVVYGKKTFLNFNTDYANYPWRYSLKVMFLWLIMQFHLNRGGVALAHQYMMRGYDLIGDSQTGAPGLPVFDLAQKMIDYGKVKSRKAEQVLIYEKNLSKFRERFYRVEDRREMISFPLVFTPENGRKFLSHLRRKGILVRYQLDDCRWSRSRKAIGLPLGMHLKNSDIELIAKIALNALNRL